MWCGRLVEVKPIYLFILHGGKLWLKNPNANSKLNYFNQNKFQVQLLAISDATSYWWVKLWKICSESPISPKLSPTKVSYTKLCSNIT